MTLRFRGVRIFAGIIMAKGVIFLIVSMLGWTSVPPAILAAFSLLWILSAGLLLWLVSYIERKMGEFPLTIKFKKQTKEEDVEPFEEAPTIA